MSNLTDADGENEEADTRLDFALSCGYASEAVHFNLAALSHEVGAMLGSIGRNPEPFLLKANDQELKGKNSGRNKKTALPNSDFWILTSDSFGLTPAS
jgi:hypothetical protein